MSITRQKKPRPNPSIANLAGLTWSKVGTFASVSVSRRGVGALSYSQLARLVARLYFQTSCTCSVSGIQRKIALLLYYYYNIIVYM